MDCPFCKILPDAVIAENELAFAVRDGFPVTDLHSLVIPKRHTRNYFSLTKDELLACHELIHELSREITNLDPSVTGFNIGSNSGKDAGQTIFHCHLHLIPRRKSDVANPRGGVRHLIPGKGDY